MSPRSSATWSMNGRRFCAILAVPFWGCEQLPAESWGPLITCLVRWQGTLTTDARVFDVQACYNSRCTSPISMKPAAADAGLGMEYTDAGCKPTTPGGPPSRCFLPAAPRPGCGLGEIGAEFGVEACAHIEGDSVDILVSLTPASPSMPDGGDQFGLMIATTDGTSLVNASGRIRRSDPATESDPECRGAAFDLSGTTLVE